MCRDLVQSPLAETRHKDLCQPTWDLPQDLLQISGDLARDLLQELADATLVMFFATLSGVPCEDMLFAGSAVVPCYVGPNYELDTKQKASVVSRWLFVSR